MIEMLKSARDRVMIFVTNDALRLWVIAQLSIRSTWVHIFTFIVALTGVHISPANQDEIAAAAITFCTMVSIVTNTPDPKIRKDKTDAP